MALCYLEQCTKQQLGARFMTLSLSSNGDDVPMYWVLLAKSLKNIETDIDAKWKNRRKNDFNQLMVLDSAHHQRRTK
jgi:membrane carboxypeptidase/penicillin-binding protein PbpC